VAKPIVVNGAVVGESRYDLMQLEIHDDLGGVVSSLLPPRYTITIDGAPAEEPTWQDLPANVAGMALTLLHGTEQMEYSLRNLLETYAQHKASRAALSKVPATKKKPSRKKKK